MANLPLIKMATEIRDLSVKAMDVRKLRSDADRTMSTLKLEAETQVAFATNLDGKKRYSNDTERKSAVAAILAQNPDYFNAESANRDSEYLLEESMINIDYLKKVYQATVLDIQIDNKIKE